MRRVSAVTWVMYNNRSSIKLYWWGREARNFNIAHEPRSQHTLSAKNCEKVLWETGLQSAEKKTACDKLDSRQTPTLLLARSYQKLGSSRKKYHAAHTPRQRAVNATVSRSWSRPIRPKCRPSNSGLYFFFGCHPEKHSDEGPTLKIHAPRKCCHLEGPGPREGDGMPAIVNRSRVCATLGVDNRPKNESTTEAE
jgi:hypothetical protein